MDQLLKVPNIKKEPTDSISSDRLKTSTEMQIKSVKQESEHLVQSEIYIKTEPQDDEGKVPIFAGTSYEKCSYDSIKFTMIKIECGDLKKEILEDPLDIGDGIKDEEYFLIDFDGETRNKPEPIEDGKDKILSATDKNDSQGSGFNHQGGLFVRYEVCKNKKYVCNVCNKAFSMKGNLDKHLRIHTGEKPFKCDVCGNSFTLKGNLNKHMLIHIGEKQYACDVCKKVFTNKSNLNHHKLIHSGVKSFLCNECNKSFTQKAHLVAHERLHTGDKPFACDVCHRAFVNKSSLIAHKRTHTGEKPYSCDICNKSFTENSNLNHHKNIHMK